jgi:3',5'-cyclic AMP phosphodiesterase CpdA
MPDQIEWYKQTSDALAAANGGEKVNSVVFQHIIVPEIYDVLEKVNYPTLFAFPRIYSENEYYRFDPDNVNYGTLNEKPCPGYENYGQFDAMVEKGDVLAVFTGHDHTNAFGVRNQGIDITNSLSTRYNGDAFSTQYGYRMITVDENDTSKYETRVVHWYNMITFENMAEFGGNKTAISVAFNGFFQGFFQNLWREIVSMFTGRTISYPDMY